VTLDKSGRWLINANYTQGSISAYPVDTNGCIQPAAQIIPFSEGSINKEKQDRAHVHAAVFSPHGDYIFFPDLGADKIRCYTFSGNAAAPLIEYPQPSISAVPGSGPRHLVFHPNAHCAYCIEELSGFVQVFRYTESRLDTIQRIAAHNGRQRGDYSSADIHFSPDGRFLYVSNRGTENNIAIFATDSNSGKLSLVGYQSTIGDHPRNFCIDPSGKFLLVANQLTGDVVVFRRNAETGLLKYTGVRIQVPGASCVQMRYIR
jgi:6-phosphogluconolactonase